MAEFRDAIDTRFPYGDDVAAAAVIARGRRLSPADDMITLSEICRPPQSAEVDSARLSVLVGTWAKGFAHPLKSALLECAQAVISGQPLSCDRARQIMREVAAHRGLYAALNLAEEAADMDDPEGFAAVEALEREIRAQWLRAPR